MSYQPGTILVRREPRSTDEESFAYDRVEVIGQSPVAHSGAAAGEWLGVESTGILIKPAPDPNSDESPFGPNLDRPLGEIQRDYEIESVPDVDLLAQARRVPVAAPGPSPEEVFKEAQHRADHERTRKRHTTPLQNDGKSPEQVLSEQSLRERDKARAEEGKSTRRRAKTPKEPTT